MSTFKYSKEEKALNKVLKMNQDSSTALLNNTAAAATRSNADRSISESTELLRSLGYGKEMEALDSRVSENSANGRRLSHRPELLEWEEILQEANFLYPSPVVIEDFMTAEEIAAAFNELDEINAAFSQKTSIVNKTDLSFLAVATAIQVAKSLIFPYVAEHFDYGKAFDKNSRLAHNDKSIEDAHRMANDQFRDKHLKNHETGHWINILYQTPPYDITKGSKDLGINMGGAYHRLYTLGHDPVLGWLFGTMNILTDVITLNSFRSYRVTRTPNMRITRKVVPMGVMFQESYEWVKDDYLNLPAAVFAQAQHLQSDEYTKLGLPVPILSAIDENFASELYKSNYDALCFARDSKIVGASFVVSRLIDIIISLVHGVFRGDEPQKLYEVRTRKILLISNAIASTSTIVNAAITSNPKNLDIGSLLNTVAHLFADVRFIAKIRQEYVQSEISARLQSEIAEVDRLYATV